MFKKVEMGGKWMSDRNASPSAFGWDFQANAAILLMIENIKTADKVRVEGKDEDIEITLMDKSKIYSQVKSVMRPDDYSNVIEKLEAALETLDLASTNGDGCLFTYITNSPNPFNNQRTMSYFSGRTHLYYKELPTSCQNKIQDIIKKNGHTNIDVEKLDIRVIPFYGSDPKNRFKEIQASVNELLSDLGISVSGINTELLDIWQRDFFHNATQVDTTITIEKKQMIWPLIVLVVDKTVANEYKKDFVDDDIEEIERKYKMLINQKTMLYEFFTKVISDHRRSNLSVRKFVEDCWENYTDIVKAVEADDDTRMCLVKIILYKILTQRKYISEIRKGVNLT